MDPDDFETLIKGIAGLLLIGVGICLLAAAFVGSIGLLIKALEFVF